MKLTTPPLSPKVIAQLADLNIHTLADLQATNPCYAFLLLKQSGLSVTKSVFWQLVALCSLKNVQDLSEQERQFWEQQLHEMPPVAIFPPQNEMVQFMQAALFQAALAAELGEVPVGAIVVHQGNIIAQAHNRCVVDCNISHHAEIQALAMAGQVLGNYRLNECDMYVSLEPCAMCASAIIQARVARVTFAASEPKTGAAGSVIDLFTNTTLNKHTAILGGVLAEEAQQQLQTFFRLRRETHVSHSVNSNLQKLT
ncbi:tRNA adenosine(34) deaminase TadA [Kingella negevensis]|uniref:tRNA adenosine(34) deaminase TadA n=1 Tax=Kingella negevensis TaxID=1522312 RepID=UPI0005C530FA|nr:tRNA adenosine(34) deaminase TadA [Kingella negevensis]MDK4687919.1 tRNA adenosine(34) deaminase TadA [Kingella negevensis]WII91091.1 tRNA adenosine(34) deaminase TadA [Kingella negevensis]